MDFCDSLYSTYGLPDGAWWGAPRTIAAAHVVTWLLWLSGPDICGLGNRPSPRGCAIVYMQRVGETTGFAVIRFRWFEEMAGERNRHQMMPTGE